MDEVALVQRADTIIIRDVDTQSPAFHGLAIQDPIIPGLTMTGLAIIGQATTGQTILSLDILATVTRVHRDTMNVLAGNVMV